MFGFVFRKTLFDAWDHILGLFLANICFLALTALTGFFWNLGAKGTIGPALTFLLIAFTVLVSSFYSVLISAYAANVSRGRGRGQAMEGAAGTVKTHVPHALFLAFILLVLAVNILFAVPFYMSMGGFTGPMMAFVGLFLALFLAANFQYYLPLCMIRREESVVEIIKYSFAYALDNKGTTAALLVQGAVMLLLSVPFVGIIPGFAGILLWDTLAVSLLNKRYVIAEEREVDKTEVPWEEVLEAMGKKRYERRRFISLLFPGR